MVCDKCQKKLTKVICPDKWKDGASNTTESGGRKINENKLLSKKKRWEPYAGAAAAAAGKGGALGAAAAAAGGGFGGKCKTCKSPVHQQAGLQAGLYCHTCAYKAGVCAMCGVKVLDTSMYKQSCA